MIAGFLERDSEKRRAQGDDFRTFLNGFVADLTQWQPAAYVGFTIGAILDLGSLGLALRVLHAE